MARLIQKSGYIQGGRAARYMEYVAKRDGVEVIQSTEPVTKKQMQFLTKLLKDFPDAKELFEYSDYLQTPNRGTASAFIAAALDTHLHELESESGYMAYIANRPRVEKHGGHGLFSAADVTDLKAAKNELETHAGKVWTFIFSLRREDAERLGYSKAATWQNLLKQESHSIAEAMRIPPEKFRWYAAYHDEGHHPHIHMMAWSDDPKVGFLMFADDGAAPHDAGRTEIHPQGQLCGHENGDASYADKAAPVSGLGHYLRCAICYPGACLSTCNLRQSTGTIPPHRPGLRKEGHPTYAGAASTCCREEKPLFGNGTLQ